MDFKEWWDINPHKEKIESYGLSEKEKKILTPVILSSSYLLTAKPFYEELSKKQKFNVTPEFILKQYALNFKRRFLTAFSYYDLEKELEYIVKHVPESIVLREHVRVQSKFDELLKKDMQFFDVPLEKGYNERIKILHDGKLLGWKFKQPRP